MSRAERTAAALNDLVHLFSEEAGLQEVALDYFTTERTRESDSEGETDLDEESAIEEEETSLFNTSTGTNIYTRLQNSHKILTINEEKDNTMHTTISSSDVFDYGTTVLSPPHPRSPSNFQDNLQMDSK